MKEWIESVLNYRSYPLINMGIRFLTTLYIALAELACSLKN